ncbi:hypothetical protein [Enterococcus wangshanyuanii]|uniref:Uncharacterized protein n=1 Tax=Enterococcus wangshanyuanii TaxID=2005703 RepID=A0ABQ1PRX6_9ENTE|nr:hypothetical protein [Enterococcus wangshanyuanii]GGD01934.1 hypothetical protein GCM10011573_34320 [Enterococcus wangshanyuanii]
MTEAKNIYTVVRTNDAGDVGVTNFEDKREAVIHCIDGIKTEVLELFDREEDYDFGISGDSFWVGIEDKGTTATLDIVTNQIN